MQDKTSQTSVTRQSGTPRKPFMARNQYPLALMGLGGLLLLSAGIVTLLNTASAKSTYEFDLPRLDGTQVRLSDYEGQVVLVNFWATWCPPCQAEMPLLDSYYQAYREQDFVLLAVNVNETPVQVQTFINENGYTFPVLMDSYSAVSDQYGVNGMPTSFIFGPDGEMIYRHSGIITADILDSVVTPLLNQTRQGSLPR